MTKENSKSLVEESNYVWNGSPKIFKKEIDSSNHYTVVDLFCGAGGASYGFQSAGFDVILGIDHLITVHGLRHTYVTQYYLRHKNDDDFDLPSFSRSIGHKDVRTTMTIYAHLDMAENRHIQRNIEDLKEF